MGVRVHNDDDTVYYVLDVITDPETNERLCEVVPIKKRRVGSLSFCYDKLRFIEDRVLCGEAVLGSYFMTIGRRCERLTRDVQVIPASSLGFSKPEDDMDGAIGNYIAKHSAISIMPSPEIVHPVEEKPSYRN
jgi:hypothetical protein